MNHVVVFVERLSSFAILPLLFLSLLPSTHNEPMAQPAAPSFFDVIHYDAQVEPNIAKRTVAGKVRILFIALTALSVIEFDCGDLKIDAVRESGKAQKFSSQNHRLSISFSHPVNVNERQEVEIEYHGAPLSRHERYDQLLRRARRCSIFRPDLHASVGRRRRRTGDERIHRDA